MNNIERCLSWHPVLLIRSQLVYAYSSECLQIVYICTKHSRLSVEHFFSYPTVQVHDNTNDSYLLVLMFICLLSIFVYCVSLRPLKLRDTFVFTTNVDNK